MSFLSDTAGKIIVTAAGSTIVGLGAAVLGSAKTNAEQTVQIEQMSKHVEQTDVAITKLTETTQALDKNVAILNERLRK
jgi:hypothetical protein